MTENAVHPSLDASSDAVRAFGQGSLTAGAMLPPEGRRLLTRGEGLPPAVFSALRDGWVTPDTPVLVRSEARILPLAWWGDPSAYTPDAEPGQIAAFASNVQSACAHWAGTWRTLDEVAERDAASIASYVSALRAAGITRGDFWRYSEDHALALVWAGSEADGTASLALHVVPASWVSEPRGSVSSRRARAWRAVPGIDVRWSWADVVALHAERMRQFDAIDLSAAVVRWVGGRVPGGRGGEEGAAGAGVPAEGAASELGENIEGAASAEDGAAQFAVRELLLETARIQPDWNRSRDEIGAEVAAVMGECHPELSDVARRRLRDYFLGLVP